MGFAVAAACFFVPKAGIIFLDALFIWILPVKGYSRIVRAAGNAFLRLIYFLWRECAMSLISVSNLTFAYEGSSDNVFENVSLNIDTDWKLGFIGRNGRGKTTFLNLLLGKYPYQGKITSAVGFEYFPFEVPHKERLTEEVLRSILPEHWDWELQRELSLLHVPENALERPFDTLSSGEQMKVLLAALFLKEGRFPLIDEATNHLDMEGRAVVSAYLRQKKGFILVSHDRAFLDDCVDHMLSINRTNVEIQKGNFTSWWDNKAMQDSFELSENEKLKKDIKRLTTAAKRTSDWSDKVEDTKKGTKNSGLKPDKGYIGHKAAKMMKRSKAIEGRREAVLDEKSALLKNIESAEKLKFSQISHFAKRLIELRDVSIFYDERKICGGVSFTIESGDRLALKGGNGSGKSSILKLICGVDISYSGTFQMASQLRISYVPQDTSHLKGSLSDYADAHDIDESLFKAILRKLDFSRIQFEKDISDFSEGQKKKVLIAGSLCEKAHLHIWDEPLNYIDVLSRMQIEELLLDAAPTILFVEHDRAFSNKIATKVFEL